MKDLRKLALGAVTGGLLSIGTMGIAAAQTDSTVRLNIAEVSEELGLSEQTSRELSPLLERLNGVLVRRQEHWREGVAIQEEIADTYEEIAGTLSATELREFHWLLRGSAFGPRADRPYGRFYNDGRMRGYADRWPAARGGRGGYGGGRAMRGGRGFAGRGIPMQGIRGTGWSTRPGWRPDDSDPKD